MRVLVVLVGFLAAAAAVAGVSYVVNTASQPDAEEAPKPDLSNPLEVATGPLPQIGQSEGDLTYDFGEMAVNQELEYAFVIKNEGEGPLKIKGGPSTCKCTLSDLDVQTIPPGEETEVKLTWKPPRSYDEFRQQAKVYTNQPDRREVLLTVTGQVLNEILVEPRGVWSAGPLSEGETAEVGGYVFSPKYADFELTEVVEAPDYVDVTWEPLSEAELEDMMSRSGYAVTVSIRPEMPLGRFTGQIRIGTNTDVIETIELGVSGSRAGPISIIGSGFIASEMTLNAGTFKSSEGLTRNLTVLVDKGREPLEVTEVTTDPPGMADVRVTPKTNTGTKDIYVMTVTVPPGVKPGLYDVDKAIDIRFKTNQPEFTDATMQIKGTVTKD